MDVMVNSILAKIDSFIKNLECHYLSWDWKVIEGGMAMVIRKHTEAEAIRRNNVSYC